MKKGWEIKELGSVCDVQRGLTYSGKDAVDFSSNVVLRATNINLESSKIDLTELKYLRDDFEVKENYRLKLGSLLICFSSGSKSHLGKVALIDREYDASFGGFIGQITPNDLIASKYLFYNLLSESYRAYITGLTDGVNINNLKAKDLKNFPIPIPPLSEQEEIVEVLDKAFAAIDQAKANIEQNIANAKELFQSKLNQIFSQKGEGWVETTLGHLIKVKHGFAFKSKFFTTEGEHVLLTPGNYHEKGGYRDRGSKQKYYVGEIPEGFILKQDDLLLAMTEQAAGLLGSPLLVPEPNRFLHNQRLGLVQHISDQPPSNRFLFHAFNTKSFRDEIHSTGTGVKVRHTSPTKICETTVNISFDAETQQEVVNTLESLKTQTDAIVIEYQTKLASLDELKKPILQKAFAGELT